MSYLGKQGEARKLVQKKREEMRNRRNVVEKVL